VRRHLEGNGERGQVTVEWVGLVLVVSLLVLGLLAAVGVRLPAAGLARTIAARLLCAVDLSEACSSDLRLIGAYGTELAARLEENAPTLIYEDGMTALPVDFRACRDPRCGNGPDSGEVWASDTGEPTAAFVHVVDCRDAEARAASAAEGLDCSEGRAGSLYLQYWLYYEDSTSLGALPGDVGHHEDDWEGYQVRVGSEVTEARATSHHGYNYDGGPGSWPSDAGIVRRPAWGSATGHLYVSGGSHAGHAYEPWDTLRHSEGARRRRAVFGGLPHRSRWTPAERLTLIPIETLDRADRHTRFAVVPPWRKPVYRDPEDQGT
jgi:hypothetical protein